MHRSFVRTSATALAVFAAMAVSSQAVSAQARNARPGSFSAGYSDVGPTLGLGGIGDAGASFGGRFEHAIKALPDFGNGTLGLEASFDYYSWSIPGYSESWTPLGLTANYHFRLTEPKFDPFVGLGLGYAILSCTNNNAGVDLCPNSGLYFIGRAGARYFFKPNLAGYADVGTGYGALHLGLMFKLQ